MNRVETNDLRSFLLSSLKGPLVALKLEPKDVPDDFDLLTRGVIDSLGFVELITAIEQHFEIQIDLADLDPENLTVVGPLCHYIEQRSNGAWNWTP